MSRDPFTWWYSVSTIARRLGVSPRTIKRAYWCGKFGGRPGEAEFQGREIVGQMFFPWPAVARFLNVPADTAPEDAPAWRAKSEGDLRRKLASVRTHGQEAVHG